jgi:CRISPR/Cas system-associated exonuclease Cas4 (RecB family)
MPKLDHEYSRLLDYLEHFLEDGVSSKEDAENRDRKLVEKQTKKLIEECSVGIHSDTPRLKPYPQSKGFDLQKFESLMRAKLIDEFKRLQSYDKPYIWVSELVICIRKVYYTRQRYAINLNEQYRFAYLSLINHVGNSVHDFIESLYDFQETEKNVISEKYKVKGRVDGIKEGFLIDIKTIDDKKFKNTYQISDYNQGLIYAYILNTEYGYKIHTITLVYVPRNLKRVIPFDLPMDNNLAKSFLENSLLLQNSISENIVPDPIGATNDQCKYCPYKKYCEKDPTKMKLPFIKDKEKKEKEKAPVFLM